MINRGIRSVVREGPTTLITSVLGLLREVVSSKMGDAVGGGLIDLTTRRWRYKPWVRAVRFPSPRWLSEPRFSQKGERAGGRNERGEYSTASGPEPNALPDTGDPDGCL